ncbi:nitroreductase family protein [Pseudoalteromonas sp. S3178]|uniref:nitroreductase family protein n=1 Tax=Pseudoalteromonas sp. S3178 TaxID=579532 RepID=UPI0014874E92|nr:nitroreductase family protein [Pseudoalteromonas sp. S3178]
MLRELLKNINGLVFFKRVVRAYSQISLNYMADCISYIRYSSSISFENDITKLEGRICVFYHALEKGLSLANPRKGFGQEKAKELIKFTLKYVSMDDYNESLVKTVLGVLDEYFKFNKDSINDNLYELYTLHLLKAIKHKPSSSSGTNFAEKSKLTFSDYEKFSTSRRSVRKYLSTQIERCEIEECINLAKYTPSVCNRQPWKAYIYQGQENVQNVLKFQHGNKGFCDNLSSLILVTSDRTKFWHALERNQAFIDGGMYSMSIVNALHAKGLGSCCLNLSLTAFAEKKLKKELCIPNSEVPIMMIAVANYEDGAVVAASERMPLKMFLGN